MKPLVLVTGGNRGIGLEACRSLAARGARVLLGARSKAKGAEAARGLAGEVVPVLLDVADPDGVLALKERVEKDYGALDVLVNNAAVSLDGERPALALGERLLEDTLETNLLGAWRMCRAFAPAMARRGRGRIVNVSSGWGALSGMDRGHAAYRVSKAALNALTLSLADELRESGVSVISLCPGWVRTEMGGPSAPRTPESAGEAIAEAALNDARTGVFLRDGKEIAW